MMSVFASECWARKAAEQHLNSVWIVMGFYHLYRARQSAENGSLMSHAEWLSAPSPSPLLPPSKATGGSMIEPFFRCLAFGWGNNSCPFPGCLKKAKIPLLTSMGTKHMYVAPWHTCGQNTHTYKKIKMFNKIKSRETPGFLTNQTAARFTLGERTRKQGSSRRLGHEGPVFRAWVDLEACVGENPWWNAVWICCFSACPWP